MVHTPAQPRSVLRAVNLVLVGQFILAAAFDDIGNGPRLALAGLVTAGFFGLALISALRKDARTERLLLLTILILSFAWMIGYAIIPEEAADPNVSLAAAIRAMAPLIACVALIGCRDALSPRLLVFGCGAVLATAAFHAVAMPRVYLDTTLRLAPFSAGLHTSAYTISLTGLLMAEFARRGMVSRVATTAMAVVALALVLGYGVRTVFLLVMVFAAADFIVWWLRSATTDTAKITILIASMAFIALLAAFIILTSFSFAQLSQFTSGRLSNYVQRFADLAARTIAQLFLGTGPGSDKLVTTVWWWAAKDSHNDFIHLMWEAGFVGLFGTFTYLVIVLRSAPWSLLAPVAALVASSAGSNALLERPNAAFLLFCLIAVRLAQPTWEAARDPEDLETQNDASAWRGYRQDLAQQFRERFSWRLKVPASHGQRGQYS